MALLRGSNLLKVMEIFLVNVSLNFHFWPRSPAAGKMASDPLSGVG